MNNNQSIDQQRKRVLQRAVKKSVWILAAIALVGLIGRWGAGLNQPQAARVSRASTGSLAPDFSLPATNGEAVRLSDFGGKKNVLLYFHEGLSCDPCMQQITELEKQLPEFEKMNVVLLTVSGVDSVEDLKRSLDSYGIKQTPLLSYVSARTEVEYNLLPYSMGMGRRAGHTFVLVDEAGIIKWRRDYWPSRGHMVAGGTMFVEAQYIVEAVKKALNQ